MCAPVCAACYWVELGSQLRVYRTVVAELTRKRRAMEKVAGREACVRAQRSRSRFASRGPLLTGFGQVVALHSESGGSGENQIEPDDADGGIQESN